MNVTVDARDAERFVAAMDRFIEWMGAMRIDLADAYIESTNERIRELEDENGMLAEEVNRLEGELEDMGYRGQA